MSGELVLTIDRILDAPRTAVWRCWTEPELMLKWFTPKPWKTVEVTQDFRPGGASLIIMESPEGERFPNPGQILEIEPGRRLVFSDAFTGDWKPSAAPFMVTEILMEDAPGGKTRYVAMARHWTAENMKKHEDMGFHPGWNAAADQLEELAKTL